MSITTQQLQDIEDIRQLKARYALYVDTQDWTKLVELFVDDLIFEAAGLPRSSKDLPTEGQFRGRDTVVAAFAAALAGVPTAHDIILPDITITGATTAQGIWAMNDELWYPTCHFRGWGHYHEDYVKLDGAWKIARIRITRTRVEEDWL